MTHRPIERGSLAQEDGWCNQVRKVLAVQDRELYGVPSFRWKLEISNWRLSVISNLQSLFL